MGVKDMLAALENPPPPKASKPRSYFPNREPLVVLECGCIESSWLLIHELAGKDYQYCGRHPDSANQWGQRILRDASLAECIRFFDYGEPAPRRRNTKPPDWMRILSDGPKPNRSRPASETLF